MGKDQEKMVVLYGSMDGHSIFDEHSFTKELYKVTEEGETPVPILEIDSLVNTSWSKKFETEDQRCKVDMVRVRNNWEDFFWPSNKSQDPSDCAEREESNQPHD